MQKGLIVHVLIINDENKILITKRSKLNDVLSGYWDVPGGTLEDGEDPSVGVCREVKEETNLDIIEPHLFFYTSNVDQEKNKQFVRLIFFVRYKGGEIVQNPEEHNEYSWVNYSDIGQYKTVDYLPDAIKALSGRNL